jgi:DNA polymerase III delta prime subunit
MILRPATRAKLQAVMRDCPHVILYGLPGCGKSTFANVFLRKIDNIYISGKSGIDVIRDKVKSFAQVGNVSTFFESDSPQPSIKYCIINEADWLSDDSQAELRMIIEDYSRITRFAFITNEIDKLHDQIRSRCIEVEFEKAEPQAVVEFVRRILAAEGISDDHVANRVNQIWQGCPGDIRRVLNGIQSMVVDGRIQ